MIEPPSNKLDLNLESHYTIQLNTTPLYKYNSCQTINIPLFGHQELPQNYKFIEPRLSKNEEFLSSIAKSETKDLAYIWDLKNIDRYLYKYDGNGIIEGIEFAPNNKSFVIIYNKQPPVHYNIKSGHQIVIFKSIGKNQNKSLAYSFSTASRYFGLATLDFFIVWDSLSGKVIRNFQEISNYKIIRDDLLISMDNNCNVKVINFMKGENKKNFKINGINSYQEILTSILSSNDSNYYFALDNGVYKMNLNNGKIENIILFKEKAKKVIISEDCRVAVSTDYINLQFWNLENKKLIGIIYKENFHSFTINFEKEKLVTSNEICIDIFKYNDENAVDRYIWLNLNPDKFENFFFSPDQKIILGIIDSQNSILYNCETGRIIKKFNSKNSLSIEIVGENSEISIIATKFDEKTIKIWNYQNGNEVVTLEGFNSHHFSFNLMGNLLACGCKYGNEIARVWDLDSDKFYYSYTYEGNNNNKNTMVHLTKFEPEKLICASEKQNPIVFNLESRELLFECECPYIFYEIKDIQSNLNNKLFFVKGIDSNGKSQAALFDLSNGRFIEQYDNCFNIDFGQGNKLLLSRSSNINNNKLVISNMENLNNIHRINCELDAEFSNFIQDNQVIVSAFGKEDKITFILSDVNTGKTIAELIYNKNVSRHAEVDLSCNVDENTLVFRYLEFINPERK